VKINKTKSDNIDFSKITLPPSPTVKILKPKTSNIILPKI